MKKISKRILSDSRGVTAVEFALIMPFFFLLLFAIIDFGWYFYSQHTIQFATREGTRLALVGVQLKDKDGNEMSREDSIIKTIQDNAALAVDPAALQISIYPVAAGYSDPEGWEESQNPGSGGDYMRVRVRYTYHFLTPLIGNFFPSGANVIQAQALYRNELF
ncbi:TadE/TadG family type IV pilus assembly protein [Syntrophus aciditrophicus]|nr:TadE family protein [Syntrophus aciditrophicus]OPY16728.1 MAG: TadE-like protein [Syntrophus sp. PtaB.Bin075]